MSEEQQIVKTEVEKQSVFKVKDFYEFYFNLIASFGFDILEDAFSKKGDDTFFEWTCIKDVSDYVRYKVWTKVKILGVKKVKVKREGIPEPMEKAKVVVKIKGKIITDWENRWGTNPITKFLKGLFDKYLMGSTLDSRRKELKHIVFVVENETKSFFELPRFM